MSSTNPSNQSPGSNGNPNQATSAVRVIDPDPLWAMVDVIAKNYRNLASQNRHISAMQDYIVARLNRYAARPVTRRRRHSVSSTSSVSSSSTNSDDSESEVSVSGNASHALQNDELTVAMNALKTDYLDDLYTEYLEFAKAHESDATHGTTVATEFVIHMIQEFRLAGGGDDEAVPAIGYLKALDTDLHLRLYVYLGKIKKNMKKEVKRLKKREEADKKAAREKKAHDNAISKAIRRHLAKSAPSTSQVASQPASQQSEANSTLRPSKCARLEILDGEDEE